MAFHEAAQENAKKCPNLHYNFIKKSLLGKNTYQKCKSENKMTTCVFYYNESIYFYVYVWYEMGLYQKESLGKTPNSVYI